jgi:hypothetical protein
MGKLYQLVIENIYTDNRYNIVSLGNDPRSVHKHVMYNVISQNERIVTISISDREVFHDSVGFITKK